MARGDVKDVRLKLNAGTTPDGFSEDVQVEDTTNVVFLPDGSAMQPREGSEIRRRDEIGFGSDRKVIYFIADPPDIDYGDMIALVNTKDGRNDVQATEVVRTTVTRSEQNPLPMPDLPDWTPLPDSSPVMYDSSGEGDSGGGFTAINYTWFHSRETNTCFGPVALTDGADEEMIMVRTESYIVAQRITYDPETTVSLSVWDLHNISSADADTTVLADATIEICKESDLTEYSESFPPNGWEYAVAMIPYRGDILYMPLLGRLYKVDLAAGTKTLVANPVSGLPEEIANGNKVISDGWGTNGSVDLDGYLWYYMLGTSDNIAILKVDPSSGVVVDYYLGGSELVGQYDAGLAVAADGSMYTFDSVFSSVLKNIPPDMSANTTVSSGVISRLDENYTGYMNNLIGSVGLYYNADDSSETFVYNLATSTVVATVDGIDVSEARVPSIKDENTFVTVFRGSDDDFYNYDMHCVNATTGDRTTIRVATGYDYTGTVLGVNDCFGYGIRNIQGAVS